MMIFGFIALMASFTFYRAKSEIGKMLELEDWEETDAPKKKKGVKKKDVDYEVHVQKPQFKTGGMIFIGPIPIVWGSDKKTSKNMWYVAIIITVILIVLTRLWVLGTFYR